MVYESACRARREVAMAGSDGGTAAGFGRELFILQSFSRFLSEVLFHCLSCVLVASLSSVMRI